MFVLRSALHANFSLLLWLVLFFSLVCEYVLNTYLTYIVDLLYKYKGPSRKLVRHFFLLCLVIWSC